MTFSLSASIKLTSKITKTANKHPSSNSIINIKIPFSSDIYLLFSLFLIRYTELRSGCVTFRRAIILALLMFDMDGDIMIGSRKINKEFSVFRKEVGTWLWNFSSANLIIGHVYWNVYWIRRILKKAIFTSSADITQNATWRLDVGKKFKRLL